MRVKSWQVGLSLAILLLLAQPLWRIASTQIVSTARHRQSRFEPSVPASTILVAAAISLQKALQEITPIYTSANPNQTVRYNFAASGILARQIEQGAPVDVFIAAADKQMNDLQQQELLVAGTQKILLTNQLVLIVPKQSSVSVANFRQLIKPQVKRISIGELRSVPAGLYATEVLKNLGIWEQVKSKFVLGNNVKSVLTTVETGDVDAGIVYLTDAKSSERIEIVATADKKLHSPIRYPVAVIKSSKSPDGARQYLEFLRSKAATTIFKKYGFGIANPRS